MTTRCEVCDHTTGDDTHLCTKCTHALADVLHTVPRLVADLTDVRTWKPNTGDGTGRRARGDHPMPMRLDAGESIARPHRAMRYTILAVAEAIDETGPGTLDTDLNDRALNARAAQIRSGRDQDPARITDEPIGDHELAALWITDHPRELRCHPHAARMHDDLRATVRACRAAMDHKRPNVYRGPCPAYDDDGQPCAAALRAPRDATVIECPRCRAQHHSRDIDEANLERARDILVTVPEALRMLEELGQQVPRSTVYHWTKTRKISPHGYRHDGRTTDHQVHHRDPAVYRLGDILNRAATTTSAAA
ncbi:hypothetical protein [Tomitella fengzijianii]|uniref:Helix-turn-helix DNA binding domain protein n=1 Tax=Tomitella fengzijianii TaxID=2597660 RepID=A0A516X4G2_9ACTN|nr:hypothetical protein [Tomitella fengzijianii]QDQ97965.1 hypothetical protein FO059_12380 [Tomitella fengzijianii]